MEDKMSSHRTQKNSNTSMAHKAKKEEMAPKGIVEEYHSPSSFQLLEVSRGAQKLNHLIDSWSKGLNDGQSKDIARELLKGALDLQDSLTMLGKLQEASQYMAQLKKKQKEKLESRRVDEVWSERANSYRSQDQNYQLGFQKPRLSAEGSSKDCIEDLRNAIRDGLARQNLLRNKSTQEKTNFDGRKRESISHFPSTSSSQLTAVQSNDIHSADDSITETDLQKKGKAPSLIAKLMGLEDIPSKSLMLPPEKQLDIDKNLNQRRPVFDVDLPKLRKPQPIMQKVNADRRTLKDLLETAQFQGILKDSSAKELKSQSHQYSDFHSKQKLIDDIPPIVLIKPLRVPCLESEEDFATFVREQRALNTKMMLRKMKTKEEFAPRLIDNKEWILNARKMHYKSETDETPIERVIQEEGAKDRIEAVVIPEEKEVRTIDQKEGAADAKKVYRKLEAAKTPVKRFSHEIRAKDLKGEVTRMEEKEVKKKLKDSSKLKGANAATQQQQKKEMTDKKVGKIQKVVASSRKPVESETVKIKSVSRNQVQAKMTSTKLRKPENGSTSTNDHISQQGVTTRKPISKRSTHSTVRNSKGQKQQEKQATEHTAAEPITDSLECKEDEKRIDHSVEDKLSTDEEANASKFQTEEYFGDSQSSLCIVTMLKPENEKSANSFKEVDGQMTHITTDGTNLKSGNQLKDLLLNCPSFLNLAEELFHLNVNYIEILPTSGICDPQVTNVKLSLDYANEFMQRRSLPDSQTTHPLLSYTRNTRIYLSLDQLVEEVCNGDETLRSYHKFTSDNIHTDSLFATLEKDIMSKGVVSGIWDLGWRNGFSVEEVEHAINDLEKLLVSELIGEIFSCFCF
ncbi:hypothetical protein JCGZ_07258 [Jatropha curcas]|uniref:DUF3741 domain-containing protein n=2 Tax=Jatropha curcas TaxID=180498 RepID=A0A067KC16_JATCU|nr:hypothetical protein JCGZ_07258 [Jatropha curcas]